MNNSKKSKLKTFNKEHPNAKFLLLFVVNLIIMIVLFVKLAYINNADPSYIFQRGSADGKTIEAIYSYNTDAGYISIKFDCCFLCIITIIINFILVLKLSNLIVKFANKLNPILKIFIGLIFAGLDIYMAYMIIFQLFNNGYYLLRDMTYTYFGISIMLLMVSLITLTIVLMKKVALKGDFQKANITEPVELKTDEPNKAE